jgi:hypothetical protein
MKKLPCDKVIGNSNNIKANYIWTMKFSQWKVKHYVILKYQENETFAVGARSSNGDDVT